MIIVKTLNRSQYQVSIKNNKIQIYILVWVGKKELSGFLTEIPKKNAEMYAQFTFQTFYGWKSIFEKI